MLTVAYSRILVETGLSAALSTKCETDARDVLRQVGLKPLLTALLNPGENMNLRDDAVKGSSFLEFYCVGFPIISCKHCINKHYIKPIALHFLQEFAS